MPNDPPPGYFIAVEGGDGAGKGSIVAALGAALQQQGHDVLLTREPGGTPEGLALRALLLAERDATTGQPGGIRWDPHAELLLMAAARVQHVQHVIRPALAAGRWVICDRYIGSTLAYQGGGRGLDPAFILTLHRQTTGDLWPHRTLLLDIDPTLGLARSRARLQAQPTLDEGRFESLPPDFHNRVRESYLNYARSLPNWHIINAAPPLPTVIANALTAAQE